MGQMLSAMDDKRILRFIPHQFIILKEKDKNYKEKL